MKDKGVLSARATFDEFRRRGLVDEQLDWTDIEAEKEADQQKNMNSMQDLSSRFLRQPDNNVPPQQGDEQ
jgi:hypothetical protein